MPNGQEYNHAWCDERHKKIDGEFKSVWEKMKTLEGRLWAIMLMLLANFGGIIAIFFKG